MEPHVHEAPARVSVEGTTSKVDGVDRAYGPDRQAGATDVLAIVREHSAELFPCLKGDAYIRLKINGHREVYEVGGEAFEYWIGRMFYARCKRPISDNILKQSVVLLAGEARFGGEPARAVHIRVAGDQGRMFWDLGNDAWEVAEARHDGWRILPESPVMFKRPAGYLPLPNPVRGGSMREFRKFVNCDDDSFKLLVGYLVSSLRARGPYAILEINGEKGSAKTTTTNFLRRLIDPNFAPARAPFKNEADLAIAADHSWLLAFDNFQSIPEHLSNALCRIATGGALSTRKLYENNKEQLFQCSRPVILNGIPALARASDLLDRVITVSLPKISSDRRLHLGTLENDFEAARPRIMGSLLDAVSSALKYEGSVSADSWPRMRDLAQWVTAAEPKLEWRVGTFVRLMRRSGITAERRVLEQHDALVEALRAVRSNASTLSTPLTPWRGRASDLFAALARVANPKDLPGSPNRLSAQLRQLQEPLRTIGIDVRFLAQQGLKFIDLGYCAGAEAGGDGGGGDRSTHVEISGYHDPLALTPAA